MSESNCEICKKPSSLKCSACHTVYYCSREHQKAGWKAHRKGCRPYKVCEDGTLGRHLVATRDIKPGESVLKEAVLIWGPSQITIPVCVGCGKGLKESDCKPCGKCGWPVCCDKCEQSQGHIPECYYTANAGKKMSIKNFGVIHPSYQCVTVLRCLYQKQFVPNMWKKLKVLETHYEEMKKTDKFESDRFHVATFIRSFFALESTFSEEDILRICGLVMVNGHEVPISDPPYVAIYDSVSMCEHNCKANCCKSFADDGELVVSSGEAIKKGDHLSICYTDSLWGTPNRRHHLHHTKFFWCSCKRCSDVTEFGTYFSVVKCQNKKCDGYMLPKTFLEEVESEWRCSVCRHMATSNAIQNLLDNFGKTLQKMEKESSQACKEFISKAEERLPKNHYYIVDVKMALAQLIGTEQEGGLPAVSDEDLDLKIQSCKQVLELIDKLCPVEKRIRGLLLFELQGAVTERGRRIATGGEGPDALNVALLESKGMLSEVAELLKNEPEALPEGGICRQAKQSMQEIDIILRTVHGAVTDVPI